MSVATALVLAYVLGSIPFSYLVARAFGVRDVRAVGSGNVGATNVLRTAGKVPGVLAFLLDASKGAAAVLLATRVVGEPWPVVAGALAVVGHMYPVWLRFQGGKGVATGAGAFAPIAPFAVAVALVAFVATLLATRYVSLGSIAGSLVLAGLVLYLRGWGPVAATAAALAVLIVWKHRGNLARIARGTERRTGDKTP